MVKVRSELNLPREVEEIFFAARSHEFLQSKVHQFLLAGKVGQLAGFVKQRLVKVKNDLHGMGMRSKHNYSFYILTLWTTYLNSRIG